MWCKKNVQICLAQDVGQQTCAKSKISINDRVGKISNILDFSQKAMDHQSLAFINKYETVVEILFII